MPRFLRHIAVALGLTLFVCVAGVCCAHFTPPCETPATTPEPRTDACAARLLYRSGRVIYLTVRPALDLLGVSP
jgi:hypothetical protein